MQKESGGVAGWQLISAFYKYCIPPQLHQISLSSKIVNLPSSYVRAAWLKDSQPLRKKNQSPFISITYTLYGWGGGVLGWQFPTTSVFIKINVALPLPRTLGQLIFIPLSAFSSLNSNLLLLTREERWSLSPPPPFFFNRRKPGVVIFIVHLS